MRFGPPESVEYNPLGFNDGVIYDGTITYRTDFPANTLIWHYPSLGMDVTLQDRLLSERYGLPPMMLNSPDPRPDAGVLAMRGDLMSTHDNRGVFPKLPPGAKRLAIQGRWRASARPTAAVFWEPRWRRAARATACGRPGWCWTRPRSRWRAFRKRSVPRRAIRSHRGPRSSFRICRRATIASRSRCEIAPAPAARTPPGSTCCPIPAS